MICPKCGLMLPNQTTTAVCPRCNPDGRFAIFGAEVAEKTKCPYEKIDRLLAAAEKVVSVSRTEDIWLWSETVKELEEALAEWRKAKEAK